MATTPYFVLSPNAVLSLIGLLHGPDRTVPTPPEDWRRAKVDVVIPAFNEAHNLPLALASLLRQTLVPRSITLIDDGSSDDTVAAASAFAAANGLDLRIIKRQSSIGKTPTIKRQARESDGDVEFILDGDTVLESDNYLERTVEELYKAKGIASACGTILPLRDRDRRRISQAAPVKKYLQARPEAVLCVACGPWRRFLRGITNAYRDVLYMFLQKFVYRGQMVFFGSITNPVGCAVAYKREYVRELFARYEPVLGDDLTNSEDIFIGFALNNNGFRNIQLGDVFARSEEPEANRLPRQVYLWSSSFLQSAYYFNALVKSPFKAFKRWRLNRRRSKRLGRDTWRRVREPYRQPFGEEYTRRFGRPIGWVILMGLFEKVFFPTALLIMILLRLWEPLLVTLVFETGVSLLILGLVARTPGRTRFYMSRPRGWKYILKGLAVLPIRYLSLFYDLVTITVFALQIWVFNDRSWRK